MSKGIVTCYLWQRKGAASVNAEKLGELKSGDEVEILGVVLGETENDYYEGTPTWYKLSGDTYIWSGGVSLDPQDLLFKEKLMNDSEVRESLQYDQEGKTDVSVDIPSKEENRKSWVFDRYGIKSIHDASKLTEGAVRVTVIDKGINLGHPQFEKMINFEDCKDFTGNGFEDVDSHGAMVCGIIGARNLLGYQIGLCPSVKVTFLNYSNTAEYIQCLKLAANLDSHIVNCSNGTSSLSVSDKAEMSAAVKKIIDSNKVFVSAYGNFDNHVYYPSKFKELEIIRVGAIKPDNKLLYTNREGYPFTICAPGVSLLTTIHENQYIGDQLGTSFSTAFVTGLIALKIDNLLANGNMPSSAIQTKMIDSISRSSKEMESYSVFEDLKLFIEDKLI